MTVTLHEDDPQIYLTNGTRIALGLEGESTRAYSVVLQAQDDYFKATGVWPHVDGMPEQGGLIPDPPEPDPIIGDLTVTGDDLTGNTVTFANGGETTLTASVDGNADDVQFKWSIRTGTSATIKEGAETDTVTLEGAEVGTSAMLLTVSSVTASDSPVDKAFTVTVV